MGVLKMRVNGLYRFPVFLGPQTQPPRPQRAPSRWGHFFLGAIACPPPLRFNGGWLFQRTEKKRSKNASATLTSVRHCWRELLFRSIAKP